jgi:tetratricopeptide (TPR) repeat protein
MQSDGSGDFVIDVPANGDYILTISYSGCNPKKFAISTMGVPEELAKDNYKPTFGIEGVIMAKAFPSINYSVLQQPLARIVYTPNGKKFDDEEGYTNQMLAELTKIREAENVLMNNFTSTNNTGDVALSKGDCPLAKASYEKAMTIILGERYPSDQLPKVGDCLKQKELADKKAAEKLEAEKLAKEKAAQEKLEADKLAKDKAAQEAANKAAQAEAEKAQKAKLAAEKAETERLAKEKAAQEKLETDKLAKDKTAQEAAAKASKAESEKAQKDKLAKEKLEADKIAKEASAKASQDKVAKTKETAKEPVKEPVKEKTTTPVKETTGAIVPSSSSSSEPGSAGVGSGDAKYSIPQALGADKYKATIKRADELFKMKRYSEAKPMYEEALKQKPNDQAATNKLAEIEKLTIKK